jgi:hypothetical protein
VRPASDRRGPNHRHRQPQRRSAIRACSLRDPRPVRPTAAVRCAEVRSASRPAGHSESGWSDKVSADVERTPDSTSPSQNLPHLFSSQPPRSSSWSWPMITATPERWSQSPPEQGDQAGGGQGQAAGEQAPVPSALDGVAAVGVRASQGCHPWTPNHFRRHAEVGAFGADGTACTAVTFVTESPRSVHPQEGASCPTFSPAAGSRWRPS